MSDVVGAPSPQQFRDLREFVTRIERRTSVTPAAGAQAEVLRSWSQFADTYVNLVHFARQGGHAEEEAGAWAVVLDLLRPWAGSDELPESLREPVAAARQAPLNPWAARP